MRWSPSLSVRLLSVVAEIEDNGLRRLPFNSNCIIGGSSDEKTKTRIVIVEDPIRTVV